MNFHQPSWACLSRRSTQSSKPRMSPKNVLVLVNAQSSAPGGRVCPHPSILCNKEVRFSEVQHLLFPLIDHYCSIKKVKISSSRKTVPVNCVQFLAMRHQNWSNFLLPSHTWSDNFASTVFLTRMRSFKKCTRGLGECQAAIQIVWRTGSGKPTFGFR